MLKYVWYRRALQQIFDCVRILYAAAIVSALLRGRTSTPSQLCPLVHREARKSSLARLQGAVDTLRQVWTARAHAEWLRRETDRSGRLKRVLEYGAMQKPCARDRAGRLLFERIRLRTSRPRLE